MSRDCPTHAPESQRPSPPFPDGGRGGWAGGIPGRTAGGRRARWAALGVWLAAGLASLGADPSPEAVVELEDFMVRESPATEATLSLLARTVGGLGPEAALVSELPRSVLVLTPEAMRQYGLRDLADLEQVGASTQRLHYYGIAGTAFLRGAKAGLYLNGLLRAYQRNEMPVSFGSAEQLDVVRGAAPAHLAPTLVGGFVNLIPKSPYFSGPRQSLEITAGSWGEWRAQADAGAPFLWGERPAAYRVSLTGQRADSYYDRVGNDFLSLYASLKVRLRQEMTLFTGGEFYQYRSNENAGWNRPTQALVDRGRYVVGEPPDLTSAAWGGTVTRPLLEFPSSSLVNPRLHSLAIPGELARREIPAGQRALLLDLNDPAAVAALYALRPDAEVPAFLRPNPSDPASVALYQARRAETQAALDQLAPTPVDAYLYTPAYFAAGGQALTAPLEGARVLADDRDYADAGNFLWFADLAWRTDGGRAIRQQFLVEGLSTDKLSSYGYGISTDQFLAGGKLTVSDRLDFLDTRWSAGAEVRCAYAKALQDFFAEPFSRRDLSAAAISPNTEVRAGSLADPSGRNLWSPQIGANLRSQLYQGALFAVTESRLGESLRLQISLRGEAAHFRSALPTEVVRGTSGLAQALRRQGEKAYWLAGISPSWEIAPGWMLYGTAQQGTGLDPSTGGVIFGDGNFSETELYESGLKVTALGGRLFAQMALFYWDQTRFNDRDGLAEPLRAKGAEWEVSWNVSETLSLHAAAGAQRVWLRTDTVGYGAVALDEAGWALQGGLLNARSGRRFPANPDLIYPGFPEVTAKLFAIWQLPRGFGLSGGPVWSDSHWHNFDRTLRLPSALLWNARLFWRSDRWEVFLSCDNLTDATHFSSTEPIFAGNTLLTRNPPRQWSLTVGRRF